MNFNSELTLYNKFCAVNSVRRYGTLDRFSQMLLIVKLRVKDCCFFVFDCVVSFLTFNTVLRFCGCSAIDIILSVAAANLRLITWRFLPELSREWHGVLCV